MSCNKGAYAGYMLVGSSVLPYLSASFSQRQDIVKSQPISNGSDSESRSAYNYSLGKKTVEGNFTVEVFGSGSAYGTAFATLVGLALSNACNGMASGDGGTSIEFCPAGGSSISIPGSGKAVITSMEIRGNNGGIVTASFGILSTDYSWGTGGSRSAASLTYESVGTTEDNSPLSYYNSSFAISSSGESSNILNYLTDWSISVNNNVEPIYTLCSDNERAAADLRLGQLVVTGNFSYWSSNGVFVAELQNGAGLVIDLSSVTLTAGKLVFTNQDLPVNDRNQAVARSIQFESMGDGENPALRAG